MIFIDHCNHMAFFLSFASCFWVVAIFNRGIFISTECNHVIGVTATKLE